MSEEKFYSFSFNEEGMEFVIDYKDVAGVKVFINHKEAVDELLIPWFEELAKKSDNKIDDAAVEMLKQWLVKA